MMKKDFSKRISWWGIYAWLRSRLHVSWMIAGFCAGILGGIGLSLLVETSVFSEVLWPILALSILPVVFYKQKRWMIILSILAGLLLGLWRGSVQRVELSPYTNFMNQNVVIQARISEDPDIGFSGESKLKLVDAKISDQVLPGQIWVSTHAKDITLRRSDTVVMEGKLRPGFGTFPASMTFAKVIDVLSGDNSDLARDLRDDFGDSLSKSITGTAHDLGMGILAGQKTALPADISEAFRIAGLTHIVVASGYNLTILIRFARRIFAKVSRLAALLGGALSALGFAMVTGFSPSMMRAVLVAGLSLLAWYFGRKFHPVILLLFVAGLTALINPSYLWGDAGWYMSFLAFAGVIILKPLITAYFWDEKAPIESRTLLDLAQRKTELRTWLVSKIYSLRDIVLETLSAQILVAPLIAFMMGNFAPYGLLSNILVLPLVPLTMLLTFIAGIAGILAPNIAETIGLPAQFLLDYIISVAEKVSQLPGALQEVNFSLSYFVLSMIALLILMFYLRYKTGYSLRNSNPVE